MPNAMFVNLKTRLREVRRAAQQAPPQRRYWCNVTGNANDYRECIPSRTMSHTTCMYHIASITICMHDDVTITLTKYHKNFNACCGIAVVNTVAFHGTRPQQRSCIYSKFM
eukprot:m.1217977 g.1217977  ORF g.1217977 m.1217977 type:complete len:111 (+) comp24618_c0_seq4:288-620(+)